MEEKEMEGEKPDMKDADDNIPVMLPNRFNIKEVLDPCMSSAYMYSDAGKARSNFK